MTFLNEDELWEIDFISKRNKQAADLPSSLRANIPFAFRTNIGKLILKKINKKSLTKCSMVASMMLGEVANS